MKTIKLLLVVLVIYGCGAGKQSDLDSIIASQPFTLMTPLDWKPFEDHSSVSYTPLKKGDNYFDNSVSVFRYVRNENPPFDTFVDDLVKRKRELLTITSEELVRDTTRLGPVYIYKMNVIGIRGPFTSYSVYFEHDGDYYSYTYSSVDHLYAVNLEEALSMLESISFK